MSLIAKCNLTVNEEYYIRVFGFVLYKDFKLKLRLGLHILLKQLSIHIRVRFISASNFLLNLLFV